MATGDHAVPAAVALHDGFSLHLHLDALSPMPAVRMWLRCGRGGERAPSELPWVLGNLGGQSSPGAAAPISVSAYGGGHVARVSALCCLEPVGRVPTPAATLRRDTARPVLSADNGGEAVDPCPS